MTSGPAYRIETERLVLRCYEPRDAELLKRAIDTSLAHLLPWLPWAREEPEPLEAKIELLRRFRAQFDRDEDLYYGIFARLEDELLGSAGLHRRGPSDARDIGYWIADAHQRRGYVTEAVGALVRVGFEVDGLARLEIHCDEANERSTRIPARLGFTLDGTLRARLLRHDRSLGGQQVWSLLRAEYARCPAAVRALRAFDAAGRLLLDAGTEPAPRSSSAFR